MPTSVRLIKASNTPRDPQATDCSVLRGGGADAHLVDVLYKLRLAAASNDAAFVMEAADMQREREKISSSVIRSSNKDGRSCLGKKCREKFMKDWPLTPKKKEALKIARSVDGVRWVRGIRQIEDMVCAPDHGKGRAENAGGGFEVKRTPELEESEAKWAVVKDLKKARRWDRAIQRVHGSKGYTEMRDKLLLVVRNRGAVTNVGGPVPMDDGEVDPDKFR